MAMRLRKSRTGHSGQLSAVEDGAQLWVPGYEVRLGDICCMRTTVRSLAEARRAGLTKEDTRPERFRESHPYTVARVRIAFSLNNPDWVEERDPRSDI